jgi:hypothetical protein
MAQAGFSGEARYALPGAALIAIAGAVGLAQQPRAIVAAASVLLLIAAVPKLIDLPDLYEDQRYQKELAADLTRAIDATRDQACGRPYVGDLRGPLLAYHLDVEKQRVAFVPSPPGTVYRSRLGRDSPLEPPTPPEFTELRKVGRWDVLTAC